MQEEELVVKYGSAAHPWKKKRKHPLVGILYGKGANDSFSMLTDASTVEADTCLAYDSHVAACFFKHLFAGTKRGQKRKKKKTHRVRA